MRPWPLSPCASNCRLDAVEELPPGVERVLQRLAHARLGRGVGRVADDDVVAHLAVLRIGNLVDVPERNRVTAQPVVLLEPAGHRPERAGNLAPRPPDPPGPPLGGAAQLV